MKNFFAAESFEKSIQIQVYSSDPNLDMMKEPYEIRSALNQRKSSSGIIGTSEIDGNTLLKEFEDNKQL